MRRPTLTTAALAAATLMMLGSTPAHATDTQITVSGSSAPASVPATMNNLDDITFETNFGVPTTCSTTDAALTIDRGADISVGNTIGTLDHMELTDCSMTSLGIDVTWTFGPSDITVRDDVGVDAGDPIPVDIKVDVDGTCGGPTRFGTYHVTGSMRAVLLPGDAGADGYLELQNGLDAVIDQAGGSSTGSTCLDHYVAGDLVEATAGTFAVTTSGANAGPINHG